MTKIWLIGAGVLLGGLLIAAVAVALLEKEDPLTEGTPEAAVQIFLLSLEDEDYDASYDLLSTELKQDCEIADLFTFPGRTSDRLKSDRITLDKTTFVNGTAVVTVILTQFRGSGPFGASESSYPQQFFLQQEEGEWKFKDYPWPLFRCGPFKVVPEAPHQPEVPEPAPTALPEPTPTPSAVGK